MKKAELQNLFSQFENDIMKIQDSESLYDLESNLYSIMMKMGRQILEKSSSKVPADRRKKNALTVDSEKLK